MKKLILAIAVCLAMLGLAACEQYDKITWLAMVNDKPITMDEFVDHSLFMGLGDEPSAMEESLRSAVLDELVDRWLLLDEAEKRGITISDNELDSKEAQLRRGLNDEKFSEMLTLQGLSRAQWRQELGDDLLARKVLDLIISADAGISTEEVRDYYNTHVDDFAVPEKILAQHVVLPSEKLALTLLETLKKGKSFEDACRDMGYQEASEPAWLSRGHMPKKLEKKIYGLKPDQLAGPYASDYGFHIVKVIEKAPAGTIPLAEAAEDIHLKLEEIKKQDLALKLIGQLRENATIKMNDDFIRSGRLAK